MSRKKVWVPFYSVFPRELLANIRSAKDKTVCDEHVYIGKSVWAIVFNVDKTVSVDLYGHYGDDRPNYFTDVYVRVAIIFNEKRNGM